MKKCYDTILFDVITILVFSLLICVNFSVPGQPRNLHANVLSPNRIEVSWSPPTDYADIRSYIVYFNDSFARQAVHRVIQPPTNNYILEELIPDTVYHIQVSATSNRGEGAKSSIIQIKTSQFGKYRQDVANVVKPPLCKQTEFVVVRVM
jgi:hypothetical protein